MFYKIAANTTYVLFPVFPGICGTPNQIEIFKGRNRMTLRFGLKESTIQKIHSVFARYPQVKKVFWLSDSSDVRECDAT
ncbi:MAG: hypothetical protein AABZ13_12560, partial [Planctomycetota bacterium]